MPTARSAPSSRVRSTIESTSVLTMPNRLTSTDSPSSTYSSISILSIHAFWSFTNSDSVLSVTSG